MATPEASDYELLTEHFGYPPVSLLDDIINTVNVLADRALESVERLLLSIPPQSLGFRAPKPSSKNTNNSNNGDPLTAEDLARREIENGTHQLETLLNASIDKNFDLFELYTMNNILKIVPDLHPFVRLAHYQSLDFHAPGQPDAPTLDSVTALRRRLHASQRLNVALDAERRQNDALLVKLRAALGVPAPPAAGVKAEDEPAPPNNAFGFLRDRTGLEHVGSDTPIATTAEFTLSQLQALRALSTSLRTLLPDLAPLQSGQEPDSDTRPRTWRRERVEYVEGASRKYLETARGLELGAQGEVRDGEWQGPGRKVTRNEVEALEEVATMLGNGKDKDKGQTDAGEAMDES
ncbi:Mis12 protein-domain-containing protein [Thelonectria olida]|uniref:Mis12 protein-domain-containing protein n=1 Tax=Thelonectria olida TaxID=1576542 RepID=A0A9P9AT44_9HYPO|nr:Mis12 protein-domain-containing protein [Thelonectria olida]